MRTGMNENEVEVEEGWWEKRRSWSKCSRNMRKGMKGWTMEG